MSRSNKSISLWSCSGYAFQYVFLKETTGVSKYLCNQASSTGRPSCEFRNFPQYNCDLSFKCILYYMLFCSRLFQLSRPPGRKTAVAVWHNGLPSDLDGIRGNVEWRNGAVRGATGSLSNERHDCVDWRGLSFMANERKRIQRGAVGWPTAKLAGGVGLHH